MEEAGAEVPGVPPLPKLNDMFDYVFSGSFDMVVGGGVREKWREEIVRMDVGGQSWCWDIEVRPMQSNERRVPTRPG